MQVEVTEESITTLEDYASVPIAFEVTKVFEVTDRRNGLDEFILTERALAVPYSKDYDAIPGEHPRQWAQRFDMSNWGLLAARVQGRLVGEAVVAFNTPGFELLEGRADLAVLWDIRVAPEVRGQGVGSALFLAVETWARSRACRQLKVETQNINVAACRLYARHGCELATVRRSAYPTLPDEIQLLWCKNLPITDCRVNTSGTTCG